MPLDAAELRRGRIVWAIYPFAADFPAEILDSGRRIPVASIEEYARLRRGRPTELITEVRLRPVLLLHDGTRGEHEDVVCLRVNTIKDKHRRDTQTWQRIERQEHPLFLLLPRSGPYGLDEDSVLSLPSIGTVHKSAIAGFRPRGGLSVAEMQLVSERLRTALSLDLAPQIAGAARRLLERAGVVEP
jgi:hypothetical protein